MVGSELNRTRGKRGENEGKTRGDWERERLQIDPLLSESDSESKWRWKHYQRKGETYTRPDQAYHYISHEFVCKLDRSQGNWIQRIGHGHVCDEIIYRLS